MQAQTIASETETDIDIVWGAAAIGAVIGLDARAAFYACERGHVPARKIGGRWVASRNKLLAHIIG